MVRRSSSPYAETRTSGGAYSISLKPSGSNLPCSQSPSVPRWLFCSPEPAHTPPGFFAQFGVDFGAHRREGL
jgi:hypothetical protein